MEKTLRTAKYTSQTVASALDKVRSAGRLSGAALLVLALAGVQHLTAHERKTAGAVDLVIGWGDEPAFAGARNSVVVTLSDRSGPIKTPATLSVEIVFGSERMTLPLEPVANRPHEYQAWVVPTRAGTYAFHVTGKVGTQPIDVTSTCSDKTFHCVVDATDIQFPAKDPTVAQLADRLERGLPRADRANDAATSANRLAIVALALSIAGMVMALMTAWRSRRSRV
jgi:hypothetical protein